ncbi:secreted RxLR effector protein 161-like [Phoenix dactylifera]|uniref:Secreted RxLR effector protein 161-like n=1 Tax=Phoenix dactylifera TaxID=42345 RepID=A0A8B8ZH99_PHODC|nr:secreted RxLR effector protein 161-like [Phoenix dactylifera]
MVDIPYASTIGSLMYAQMCTRPDIAFVVGLLGRFPSDPGKAYWDAAKKVFRKSTSVYVFLLAGQVVSWKSQKQSITAPSTMAAEYIACFEATSQAI